MPPGFMGGICSKKMNKDLIIKYLNNRCTEKELDEVCQWIETQSANQESRDQVFGIWEGYHDEDNVADDEKLIALFDKIQQKIETGTGRTTRLRLASRSVFVSMLTKAAAIILVPVLAFLLYTLSERKSDLQAVSQMATEYLEVFAPIGSRTLVHLPDGTEVHLNYGSTLKYPPVFYGETREVTLMGEGYFDVAQNQDKPFIVRTGNLGIKAVGTEFNVQSYPDDGAISTTLVEGKVILERHLANGKTEPLGAMQPNQHVIYHPKSGDVTSSMGKVENYISWKEGKMIFEDTPIEEVAQKLSRMFNVDIEVDDNIKDYYYTVTFVDEPLYQILDLMTIATPVSYKALPRKKMPDGTFSKQKILIERKNK